MYSNKGTNRTAGAAVRTATITATDVLVGSSLKFQRLNPSTADRDVTLPDVATGYNLWFCIVNTGTTYNLVVKNAGGTTITTIRPGCMAIVASDATDWTVSLTGQNGGAVSPINRHLVTVSLAAADVDKWAFVADRAYTVKSIKEIHSVAGNDGGAVTLDVRKITAATVAAPGAAAAAGVVEMLSAALNLKSTADTTVAASLSAVAGALTLAAGDKIGLNFIGTLTALAGGNLTIELEAL